MHRAVQPFVLSPNSSAKFSNQLLIGDYAAKVLYGTVATMHITKARIHSTIASTATSDVKTLREWDGYGAVKTRLPSTLCLYPIDTLQIELVRVQRATEAVKTKPPRIRQSYCKTMAAFKIHLCKYSLIYNPKLKFGSVNNFTVFDIIRHWSHKLHCTLILC